MSEESEKPTIEFIQAEFEVILIDVGFSKVLGKIIFWFKILNIAKGDESYSLFQIEKGFDEWLLDIGFVNIL